MSTPRFHAADITGETVTLDADQSRHALLSLRLKPGNEIVVFDGRGKVARGTLLPTPVDAGKATTRKRSAVIEIIEITRHAAPQQTLTLYVAGCKGPRLGWLVEKCTELGVTRLVFTEFERSVVKVSASHAEKLSRTTIEACKQCERVWLPEIDTGRTLAELMRRCGGVSETAPRPEHLLVAHPRTDDGWSLANWLRGNTWHAIGVVIGPEGGLTDEEIEALRLAGAAQVHLAEHVLRVETAALSAAAIWAGSVWA